MDDPLQESTSKSEKAAYRSILVAGLGTKILTTSRSSLVMPGPR